MTFGLKDIEVKMSLFIFPLLLATSSFKKQDVYKIMYSFVAGCFLCGIAMLSRALYSYVSFGENNFYYQSFAFLLHPSYLSMYINLGVAFILLQLTQLQTNGYKFICFLIISFFAVLIVLLSSKMGLISMLLILFGFMLRYIVKFKKYVLGISGLFAAIVLCFCLIKFVPAFVSRFDSLIHSFKEKEIDKASIESTDVRRLVWGAAKKVVSKNIVFGVGTGDSKDALMEEYKAEGLVGAYDHKLNAHNEYFQVFVALGLVGFVLLLLNLFVPLMHSFKYSNTLYFIFILIIILNFAVESMFETQAGVMFYAFFNSLLCFGLKTED